MQLISQSEIKIHLISILNSRYNIPLKSLDSDQWDVPLTSRHLGLTGFMLVQFFFDIEKEYDKRFDASVLENYRFCTINNISHAIYSS